MDWEFPTSAADKANCTALRAALRAAMPAPTWIISMAVGDRGDATWASAYYLDLTAAGLRASVDFFNVMDYDAHGTWSVDAGHESPQYRSAADGDLAWGLKESLDWYVTTKSVPATQINSGMAFYGVEFKSVN